MKKLAAAAVALAAGVAVGGAAGARDVSHAAYAALLRQADADVTKAETPVEHALQSRRTTVAHARRLMLAWASTETALGRRFAAVRPPEPAAEKANRDLSRGELDLGAETRSLTLQAPTSSLKAFVAYLQRHNPKGGPEIDHALAELKAAGYSTGG